MDAVRKGCPAYDRPMTSTAAEPSLPPADEPLVQANPGALQQLARQCGDALDITEFELTARHVLRADGDLFSAAVLSKPHVSPDLTAARPL